MCASMHIFLLALMIQSGLAIQCYDCDSDSNPSCGNKTDVNVKPVECNDEKQREIESQYNSPHRHWLLKISDIHYHRPAKSKSDTAKMVCQKLIGTDDDQKTTIIRRCQLANVECSYSDQQLASQFPKTFAINECAICEDKDGCNGSPSNRVFGMAIGVAIAVHLIL